MSEYSAPLGDIAVRAPQRADLSAVVDLINAASLAEGGAPDMTPALVLADWEGPNFDLAADAWLALDARGSVLGYETLFYTPGAAYAEIDGYVHPAHKGRGIGTRLLRLAEARARALAGAAPPALHANIEATNQAAQALFAAEGYRPVRHFWRMEILFEQPPAAPAWPAGMAVRAFVPGRDERVTHAAIQEAFQDHWGFQPTPFDEWRQAQIGRADFDPALWFLAFDREELAGVVLGFARTDELGWVRNLGVRRPWRGRGVGMALLRQAFGAFYARGIRMAGLGVDAQNLSGATRLYERAGMRVAERYDTLEKVPSA